MRLRIGLVIAATLSLCLAGCDESGAKRAIEDFGLSDVTLGGMPWFGCGNDDNAFYNHSFEARNTKGRPVKGVVCGGPFKGYTVRIM